MPEKVATERFRSNNEPPRKIRVTMIIPYELDRNVEAYSVREGMKKTDVVAAAIREFLHKRALQPNRAPKISINY